MLWFPCAKSNLQVSENSNFVFLCIFNIYFCVMQYNSCQIRHWISCNYVFSFIVPRLSRLILVFLFSLKNKKDFCSIFFVLFLPIHLKVITSLVNYFFQNRISCVQTFHVQHLVVFCLNVCQSDFVVLLHVVWIRFITICSLARWTQKHWF